MTSNTRDSRTTVALLIFATFSFGLAVRGGQAAAYVALPATLILIVALTRVKAGPIQLEPRHADIRLLVGLLVFVALALTGWAPSSIGPTSSALETAPYVIWGALGITVFVGRRAQSLAFKSTVVALTIGLTAVVGAFHIRATDGLGIDVLFLHKSAAEAIANGQNPYTDAVSVPNGAPTAEPGDVIEGYVYPPVTALAYAAGEWVFSDPRYTSLIAWLSFLAIVGVRALRRKEKSQLLVLLLAAAIPGWPLVLRAAWTEPLSLALGAAAFSSWTRPTASGAFLGLTLASKQYFAVTAPVIALFRDGFWLRRAVWATVVILTTIGAVLALDPSAFWNSAVAFHTSTPPRADSSNLVGLFASLGIDWDPPSLLPIVVGLAIATWAGLRATTRQNFFLALALTLATSFMVSPQAFANYWLLVFGLCVLGLVAMGPQADSVEAAAGGPTSASSLADGPAVGSRLR